MGAMTTMSWTTRYLPPDPNQWRGRADAPPLSCFFQIISILNLLQMPETPVTYPAFAVIGFRSDEGIRRNAGRVGAADGPAAIRHALGKIPLHNETFSLFDAGSITCADEDLEASQKALGAVIDILLTKGIIPIVLGGGHEVAWGNYQGIARKYTQERLGIINFSAYFDMRPLLPGFKGSSGTPFLQIAEAHTSSGRKFDYNCIGIQHVSNIRQLFDTARSFGTNIIFADELHHSYAEQSAAFIRRIIQDNDLIYVSLSLDVFAAAYAPGVSASQPSGLAPWNIIPLLRQLAASGKVVSYDIAELSPRYDVSNHTAKLAATLVYEIIHNNPQQR
jgi:formiminoglutamase